LRDNRYLEKGESMAQGKPYPPEYKEEAARLYRMGVRTLAETAREIGVSDLTLARFLRQAET